RRIVHNPGGLASQLIAGDARGSLRRGERNTSIVRPPPSSCIFSPGLVEKVQELASIDENEAASRIKKSLKNISELDGFMCVAGVVQHSVSCHRREDGQKQLVDLNRDCWLHIRRYLKVGDILDSM
ncbi:hypothetical protein MTO96_039133, partial [Rhipicephalus appendiculatus]